MEDVKYDTMVWDFAKIDNYIAGCLQFADIVVEGCDDTDIFKSNSKDFDPTEDAALCDYDYIIKIIIRTLDFASKFIKESNAEIEKYDFVFNQLNHYIKLLSEKMGIDWEYSPTDDELHSAFDKYYIELRERSEEDDLLGCLRDESGENITSVDDSSLFNEYQSYLTDKIRENKVKENPNYKQYANLRRYFVRLFTFMQCDAEERAIKESIFKYNTAGNITTPVNANAAAEIESIICYEDKEKAKNIIKDQFKGLKCYKASVLIQALIKLKIIKRESLVSRNKMYKAITDFTGYDIGSKSGLNEGWSGRDTEVDIMCQDIKQLLQQN